MEILASMIAFFALVISWFILPAAPRTTSEPARTVPEGLATAA